MGPAFDVTYFAVGAYDRSGHIPRERGFYVVAGRTLVAGPYSTEREALNAADRIACGRGGDL
jgi:hypothetical protein